MKTAALIAALAGFALLAVLLAHSELPVIVEAVRRAGVALFWLVPYRLIFFMLYAIGWRALLQPFDADPRISFGYVLWVTTVREAVDRLLPVASIGGGVIGVRLMTWRGLAVVPVTATVIVEIILNLFALGSFGLLAAMILFTSGSASFTRQLIPVLMAGLAIPVFTLMLVRSGSLFQRAHLLLRPFVGMSGLQHAGALDSELHFSLDRTAVVLMAGLLQLAALISASFEIWWALYLFGHPIGMWDALMLEGLSQVARNLAFFVPAGLGIQEAALVMLGHGLGISGELALAVSAAKRAREILCGVPPLLSWQWLETRRLRTTHPR